MLDYKFESAMPIAHNDPVEAGIDSRLQHPDDLITEISDEDYCRGVYLPPKRGPKTIILQLYHNMKENYLEFNHRFLLDGINLLQNHQHHNVKIFCSFVSFFSDLL